MTRQLVHSPKTRQSEISNSLTNQSVFNCSSINVTFHFDLPHNINQLLQDMYHESDNSCCPPPLLTTDFPQRCGANSPPPYQESLPENHLYKSGTKAVPGKSELSLLNQMLLSDLNSDISPTSPYVNYTPQPNSDLDATYEHAYCHNLILPIPPPANERPGCSGRNQTSLGTPSSSSGNHFAGIWKQLTNRHRHSNNKVMKVKNATLKRSISQVNLCEVKNYIRNCSVSNLKAHKDTPCSSPSSKGSSPPHGIVKPPRKLIKKCPATDDQSLNKYYLFGSRTNGEYQHEQKLRKSVSFNSQLNNVRVLSPEVKDGVFQFPFTYFVNDYVFTKL